MKRELLLSAVLLTTPALAQDVDCKNAMTQMAMNVCAGRDYEAADKLLNSSYTKLLRELDDVALKTKLKAAQKSWIAFRDNECTFETAGSEGGTIHPLEYSSCLTKITKERTKAIEALTLCQKHAETCQ